MPDEPLPVPPDESNLPDRELPRVWPTLTAPLAALFLTIILQALIALALAGQMMAQGVSPAELQEKLMDRLSEPGLFILTTAVGQLVFGLTAILAAWLSPMPIRERLGLLPIQGPSTLYPLTMIGSLFPLAIGFGLALGLERFLLAFDLERFLPVDPTVEALLNKLTPGWWIVFILFIALAPGICEELLFRGYLQRRLLQRWYPATAIAVASVIFSLMHIMPQAILLALPLGLWFGVVAWRTGSVFPGMVCHAFVNGAVNLVRMVMKYYPIPEPAQWTFLVVAMIAGVICFGIAWVQLWKLPPLVLTVPVETSDPIPEPAGE